jgi:hypothetical protein
MIKTDSDFMTKQWQAVAGTESTLRMYLIEV